LTFLRSLLDSSSQLLVLLEHWSNPNQRFFAGSPFYPVPNNCRVLFSLALKLVQFSFFPEWSRFIKHAYRLPSSYSFPPCFSFPSLKDIIAAPCFLTLMYAALLTFPFSFVAVNSHLPVPQPGPFHAILLSAHLVTQRKVSIRPFFQWWCLQSPNNGCLTFPLSFALSHDLGQLAFDLATPTPRVFLTVRSLERRVDWGAPPSNSSLSPLPPAFEYLKVISIALSPFFLYFFNLARSNFTPILSGGYPPPPLE